MGLGGWISVGARDVSVATTLYNNYWNAREEGDDDDFSDFLVNHPKKILITNPLSAFWKEEKGVQAILPLWILGILGYGCIGIARRALGVVKDAFLCIVLFIGLLHGAVYGMRTGEGRMFWWCVDHLKDRVVCLFGSLASLANAATLGLVAPPLAYKVDEWIQSNYTINQGSLFDCWMGMPTSQLLAQPGRFFQNLVDLGLDIFVPISSKECRYFFASLLVSTIGISSKHRVQSNAGIVPAGREFSDSRLIIPGNQRELWGFELGALQKEFNHLLIPFITGTPSLSNEERVGLIAKIMGEQGHLSQKEQAVYYAANTLCQQQIISDLFAHFVQDKPLPDHLFFSILLAPRGNLNGKSLLDMCFTPSIELSIYNACKNNLSPFRRRAHAILRWVIPG